MSNFWRMVTTVMIWLMGLGAGGLASYGGPYYTFSPIPLLATLIAVVIATRYIWISALSDSAPPPARSVRIASRYPDGNLHKAKRSSTDERLQTLMALMTPEERESFIDALQRQALEDARWNVSRDGELPYDAASLEDLIGDEPRRRRR